jgi:hypothetical protein
MYTAFVRDSVYLWKCFLYSRPSSLVVHLLSLSWNTVRREVLIPAGLVEFSFQDYKGWKTPTTAAAARDDLSWT